MEYSFEGTKTAMGHPLIWRVIEREDENSRVPFGVEAVSKEYAGSWVIPICDIECISDKVNKDILRADAYLLAAAPDLLQVCIEVYRELNKQYESECSEANWYNNNMPGVGQNLDYMSLPEKPKELTLLQQAIHKALNLK